MLVRILNQMESAGYGVYNHSAVEICHWNKKAIKGEAVCYKHKFYGIESHRCMQISQAAAWCSNRCVYCWRPMEFFLPGTGIMDEKSVDPPEETLEKLLELRKQLLSGFGGNEKVNKEVYKQALLPSHVTFSLIGEPMLYPYIVESIKYIRENWSWVKSIFIVTNGLFPEQIEKMWKTGIWPTQLYVSFTGPDKETYRKVSRPIMDDYWERFLKTLDLLREAPVRKVARVTLIRGVNDFGEEGYAELIERFNPHFVEVKAYMYLGFSRKRLKFDNVPSFEEVKTFTRRLAEYLPGYEYWKDDEPSRVSVLKNRREGMDIDPIIRSPEPNVIQQVSSASS